MHSNQNIKFEDQDRASAMRYQQRLRCKSRSHHCIKGAGRTCRTKLPQQRRDTMRPHIKLLTNKQTQYAYVKCINWQELPSKTPEEVCHNARQHCKAPSHPMISANQKSFQKFRRPMNANPRIKCKGGFVERKRNRSKAM